MARGGKYSQGQRMMSYNRHTMYNKLFVPLYLPGFNSHPFHS